MYRPLLYFIHGPVRNAPFDCNQKGYGNDNLLVLKKALLNNNDRELRPLAVGVPYF